MIVVMLLAGCLSYSNSAMNPVLYAFLSENFKKSFMKACTCATGRDANAALHVENSAFPRRRTLGTSAHGHHGHRNHANNTGNGGSRYGNSAGRNGLLTTTDGDERHEMNDISTGVTTLTSRSSRSFEGHSQITRASDAGLTTKTTTFNGNLAPPPQML